MFKIEHNVLTGEIKKIPFTAAEIKASEKAEKEFAEKDAIDQAEAEAKSAQRQAILDRLGLTSDETKLLLG